MGPRYYAGGVSGVACQACLELGLETTVFCHKQERVTDLPVHQFRTGDQHHQHDSNDWVLRYECGLGHSFEFLRKGKPCWCGWEPAIEPEDEAA